MLITDQTLRIRSVSVYVFVLQNYKTKFFKIRAEFNEHCQ
jgi:hypothetical protein